jgi:vitamin B12 transporter
MLGIVREWSVYFVLLCVASVPPVWTAVASAEEPLEPDPVVQAEEVVVSATKTPLPVSQVTSAVEVITAQDMKRQNIRSVVDALRLAQVWRCFQTAGPAPRSRQRFEEAVRIRPWC